MAQKQEKAAKVLTGEAADAARWREEIAKSQKRLDTFHQAGEVVQDKYRMEHNNGTQRTRDRYNMLYSSTETMKPSLYTKTPKVEAVQRHKDRQNFNVVAATVILEAVGQYCIEDFDFDTPVSAAIEDFLLPGMGQLWVRYEPEFAKAEDGTETILSEGIVVDHVYWKDFAWGMARTWPEVPWVARRCYFNKTKATARFGTDKANKLAYSFQAQEDENGNKEMRGNGGDQAIIWQICDKDSKTFYWVSTDYPDGYLDKKADPLRLKGFFPCPQPIRAVSTNRTFTPKSFYNQYMQQAEAVDEITARIRHLTKALRVVGVYDKSQVELQRILQGDDNKMVAVENWAQFQGQGGIAGVVDWVPIKDIAAVLTELYKQREIAKSEIYEITGFSDIVRGVSKASETLGAQEIKNEWAGGRLRSVQTKVQNFIRDTIAIVTEIALEHFDDVTMAMYCGFEPPEPTPEEQAALAQYAQQSLSGVPGEPPQTGAQEAIKTFKAALALLRDEGKRCAILGIETDSTIQPDEAQERKDRVEFLGQIGAFLQQAGPMALQYPDMRGLLGSIMMFVIHTFRSSRGVEKEFEEFAKKLEGQPAMAPPGSEGQAKEDPQAEAQKIQMEQQGEQQLETIRQQAATQQAAAKEQTVQLKMSQDHDFRMKELDIKNQELDIKRQELELKRQELGIKQAQAEATVQQGERKLDIDETSAAAGIAQDEREQEHGEAMDHDQADRSDRQFDEQTNQQEQDRKAAKAKPDKGD